MYQTLRPLGGTDDQLALGEFLLDALGAESLGTQVQTVTVAAKGDVPLSFTFKG